MNLIYQDITYSIGRYMLAQQRYQPTPLNRQETQEIHLANFARDMNY